MGTFKVFINSFEVKIDVQNGALVFNRKIKIKIKIN
jgi:hypothetical protein